MKTGFGQIWQAIRKKNLNFCRWSGDCLVYMEHSRRSFFFFKAFVWCTFAVTTLYCILGGPLLYFPIWWLYLLLITTHFYSGENLSLHLSIHVFQWADRSWYSNRCRPRESVVRLTAHKLSLVIHYFLSH